MTGVPYTFATATSPIPLSQLDSNFNTTLTIGSTSVGLGNSTASLANVSLTGSTSIAGANITAALTYGGVTLSNAVTGTGNMVLSASPTLTGTMTAAAANFSGAQTNTVAGVPYQWTGNGAAVYPSFTGGGAVEYNFSNGNAEVDFWNTANSPTQSFMWRQQTGASSNTTLMTLSPAGLLGIGMTPTNVLDITQANAAAALASIKNTTAGTAAKVGFQALNDVSSYFNLLCYSSTFTTNGVQVASGTGLISNGTLGLSALNGPILFATNGTAEVARFTTTGQLCINSTSGNGKLSVVTTNATALYVLNNGSSSDCIETNVGGTGVQHINFYYQGTLTGSITPISNTGVAYNVTSDQRLKTNIIDASEATSDLLAVKVRSFDWKVNNVNQKYGMIAQELLEVAPDAVHVPADPELMMGVDYSKLVPMMIKTIQELTTRLAALESK